MDNIFKIGGTALKYLFGVLGFALGIAIVFKGAGVMVDIVLWMAIVLLILCAAIAIVALVIDIAMNFKKRIPMVASAAGFALLVLICYLVASDDITLFETLKETKPTVGASKWVGAGLILTLSLLALSIASIVFGWVLKFINR